MPSDLVSEVSQGNVHWCNVLEMDSMGGSMVLQEQMTSQILPWPATESATCHGL